MQIDSLVKGVLSLSFSERVDMKGQTREEPDIAETDDTATLVRIIAAEGIILLKNQGNTHSTLPGSLE